MKAVRTLFKVMGGFVLAAIFLIIGYFCAAAIGSQLPRPNTTGFDGDNRDTTIYLLSGLLHTDIAIPFDEAIVEQFPELTETSLPLDNPGLKYLSYGWGSEAFYTTAGEYSDIKFTTAWKAATGDRAVIRVVGLPKLEEGESIRKLALSKRAYKALLRAIHQSFERTASGRAKYLRGHSIGPADAFFSAKGHFNLFNPCNQWTGDVLARAGVRTGRWTPTTYSLLWSLD